MSLFISQGLLVTSSQESNEYMYNTVLAVLVTEMAKFVICVAWYTSRNSCTSLFEQTLIHIKLLWLYFIPATLYCLYNNLAYVNLLSYDPATYFILLQLRVVITAVLFQILFKKFLTPIQWLSLILLTIGCMVKNMKYCSALSNPNDSFHFLVDDNRTISEKQYKSDGMNFNFSAILIILQVLCSCFAGVYSELLLKSDGLHVDIFIQNAFLYIDSIACNIIVLCWEWNPEFFSQKSFEEIMDFKVLLVILNNATVGIVTSFFLKYLNSILKTIAAALELVFITILSRIFFNIPITLETVVSISIVSFSILLYSRNPVQNPTSTVQFKKLINEDV